MPGDEKGEPEEQETVGVPAKNRVKRKYTLSPEALFARRQNAQRSTGPRTAEGKGKTKRNAWKHGKYASTFLMGFIKPCKSTCPHFPCPIVEGGKSSPGNACLDKEHFIEVCDAIEQAFNGSDTELKNIAIAELAANMQVIRELREAIIRDGVLLREDKVDKEGNKIGDEYKLHPGLLAFPKLIAEFGLTLPEYLLTPRSVAKANAEKDLPKNLSDIFGGIGKKLKGKDA